MAIVLRASSPVLDLDACLRWIPSRIVEAAWRVGDIRLGRSPERTAGFNLLIAESTGAATIGAAHTELLGLAPHLLALSEAGIPLTLDCALEVGPIAPKSLTLGPSFLQLLVEIGIELSVSAYPCED